MPPGIPFSKRSFDLLAASLGLLVLSPLMGLLAVLVRLKLGRPVLFRQARPGYKGRPFTAYKFRSMTDERDDQGRLLPDAKRITPFGHFLRRTSLDDLPQAWNVLRGEMSVVGPRPLLMKYLELYTPEQMRRHDMLPGITGWAQVNGRNALTWDEKFRLDLWYIDHWSFWLDLRILLLTIPTVLSSRGVTPPGGGVTAEEFRGPKTGD